MSDSCASASPHDTALLLAAGLRPLLPSVKWAENWSLPFPFVPSPPLLPPPPLFPPPLFPTATPAAPQPSRREAWGEGEAAPLGWLGGVPHAAGGAPPAARGAGGEERRAVLRQSGALERGLAFSPHEQKQAEAALRELTREAEAAGALVGAPPAADAMAAAREAEGAVERAEAELAELEELTALEGQAWVEEEKEEEEEEGEEEGEEEAAGQEGGVSSRWVAVDESDVSRFEERLPALQLSYPFELDPFQKRAILHLERNEHVFVAAHTSAGKSVVAEYAIALALAHEAKAIYTSPVKALSNQKYRDFKRRFGDVGLLTGDVCLHADASCLVMTTEILRDMLHRGAPLLLEVEWVIFDEIHYISNEERGVIWEEAIIMLPASCGIVGLSATAPNHLECAEWIGRTKRRVVHVVSTPHRPTPLLHCVYAAAEVYRIVDDEGRFLAEAYERAARAERSQPRREGYWAQLVQTLQRKDLLPVVVFSFSKAKCDEISQQLKHIDLLTAEQKREVSSTFDAALERLDPSLRRLPSLVGAHALLRRGIGAHHSGLLPLLRELVELLFVRGLVPALFATETFATGLNMPARSVVFNGIRKNDGSRFRELLPAEYTQMSGRAGRRGIDARGVALVGGEELPEARRVQACVGGAPSRLSSKFCLSDALLLSLLRAGEMRADEMVARSFLIHGRRRVCAALRAARRALEAARRELRREEAEAAEAEAGEEGRGEGEGGGEGRGEEGKGEGEAKGLVEGGGEGRDGGEEAKGGGEGWGEEWRRYCGAARDAAEWCRAAGEARLADGTWRRAGRVVVAHGMRARAVCAQPAVVLRVEPRAAVCVPSALRRVRVLLCVCLLLSGDDLPQPLLEGVPPVAPALLADFPVPILSGGGDSASWDVLCLRGCHIFGISTLVMKQVDDPAAQRLDPTRLSQIALQLAELPRVYHTRPLPLFSIDHELGGKSATVLSQESCDAQRARLEAMAQSPCHRLSPGRRARLFAAEQRREWLDKRVRELDSAVSEKEAELAPSAHAQLALLRRLHYLSETDALTSRGRVACEIRTAVDTLVVVELLFDGALAPLDASELAALLSAFIAKGKPPPKQRLTVGLQKAKEALIAITHRIAALREKSPFEHERAVLNFTMLEVVHEWVSGKAFDEVCRLTTSQEGDVVRCFSRLEEVCKEVRNAARIMGDVTLFQKMESVIGGIKRDIVVAPSLYTT
ncbi:hypothetical protein AB1Y20_016961 [Prymnesium parvum]|uniref:Helicase SKI2W n=1 Tax=Prymnesium parvum TaxID=97485 RepID=A0AB34I9L1_PRYPA